jgi:predicted permease
MRFFTFEFRRFTKNLSSTVIIIITLALAIGTSTAIFSVVDALFFRRLPAPDADQIVGVYGTDKGKIFDDEISEKDYAYYRDNSSNIFSEVAAHYSTSPLYIVTEDQTNSQQLQGSVVSSNYFSLLGLTPQLGRFFIAEEDSSPLGHPVAVLSYDLWHSTFGGDTNIVGKTIHLNGVAFSIIGVAPQRFRGIYSGISNDIWIPLSMSPVGYRWCNTQDRTCDYLNIIARLKHSVSIESAQSTMSGLMSQINKAYPSRDNAGKDLQVVYLRGMRPSEKSDFHILTTLLIAAGILLLLIACTNLGGLLLVQGIGRSREMAIRVSLGASRWQVTSQLLKESAILAVIGAGVGLTVAQALSHWLSAFLFIGQNGISALQLELNRAGLLFTLAVCIGALLLFGLVPAFVNSRPDLTLVLKEQESVGGYSGSQLRRILVGVQVALTVILLIGAGLLMKSLNYILSGPGFSPTHIAYLRLTPLRLGYAADKAEQFQREVMRRVESMPEIESANLMQSTPWSDGRRLVVTLPGQDQTRPENRLSAWSNSVTPGFFKTIDSSLLRGRDFAATDDRNAPKVAIVNNVLADKLWPNKDPIGQAFIIKGAPYVVVGVSNSVQYQSAIRGARPFLYTSFWQNNDGTDARMLVRTRSNPGQIFTDLRHTIQSVSADVPISEEMTMVSGLQRAFGEVFLARNIFLMIGGIALVLSLVGLYGMLAFFVVQRTREIGIRSALGAQHKDIVGLILRQGTTIIIGGTILGVLATAFFIRFMESILYGIKSIDLATFVAVPLALWLLSSFAIYFPVNRAVKISPLKAIRYE